MIIKSSQRSGYIQLADHLTNTNDNEIVEFTGSRNILSSSIHEALEIMECLAKASLCQQHLFHVSISPDDSLSREKWEFIWSVFEDEYGLNEHPYIEVFHVKNDRRHCHRVYERVDERGKAVKLSFNRIRNEKISRRIEYDLDLPLTLGRHTKSVIKHLKKDGRQDVATWLENNISSQKPRPQALASHSEQQQAVRTQVDIKQVKEDMLESYHSTKNGKEFQEYIREMGYVLARGDRRRCFVIVDFEGGVHAPRRRLSLKARVINERWSDITLSDLPSVSEVQKKIKKQKDKELQDDLTKEAVFTPLQSEEIFLGDQLIEQQYCQIPSESILPTPQI